MPIIKSKKFILRPIRKSDAPEIARLANDKTVYKNTAVLPYPYTIKDANWWIADTIKNYRKKKIEKYAFAIDIAGKFAGVVALEKIVPGHKATLGYWLGREYWGQGIMTDAVKLVSDFAFRQYKIKRLYAYAFPWNKASMRVMEKTGMKFEGVHRKNTLKNGKLVDDYVFAKVK
jgi:RimJ/RimL family protein N-acetyltransferase